MLELYARPVHERFKRQALKCHAAIDRACDVMRRATDALGADDDTLVDVLTSLAPRDRALAVYRYKDKFREELKDTLGSDPVGDFRILLLLLTMPAPEAEAFLLHMAVTRWPSREKFIYTVRPAQRLGLASLPCRSPVVGMRGGRSWWGVRTRSCRSSRRRTPTCSTRTSCGG
jgi:hypothetical protein